MPILGIIASSIQNAIANASSYESIATVSGSGVSTITFSSIPATYKHLQLRIMLLLPDGSNVALRFNGDTGANYALHYMMGNGNNTSASNSTSANQISNISMANNSTTYPGVSIANIIDYASTTKYKTVRHFTGTEDNDTQGYQSIRLASGLWQSTSAVTSITLFNTSATNFGTNTSIALYGIKGA
jgi:hypothetical protein